MGRRCKDSLDYFSLYTDFFTEDPIVDDLRCEFGSIGILTFLYLECRIHGEGGYWFEMKSGINALCRNIATHIANSHPKHVAECARATIDYLIEQGYVDRYWFERSIVTGISFQERYVCTAIKMKRKFSLDVCQLVDVRDVMRKNKITSEEMRISSEEIAVSSEEMQQSKGKVKEKENSTLYSVYGTHKNVRLTDAQYKDIKGKIPDADSYIDHFSERLKARGYTIKDHHGAILAWWEQDKDKQEKKAAPQGSFDTDDFFQAALNKGFRTHRED